MLSARDTVRLRACVRLMVPVATNDLNPHPIVVCDRSRVDIYRD